MARAKRMGAYNALDDLLCGPGRPRLEPVPDPTGDHPGGPPDPPDPPPPPPRRPAGRRPAVNALDELLPGPRGLSALDDLPPRPRRLNALDDLLPGPSAPPARARVSFRLPADLVEEARDAVAHLAGTADRTTLTALAERALRAELARLAAAHRHGRPFPRRHP
jgi:hypothetical protein